MRTIITHVTVSNAQDVDRHVSFEGMVDTGSTFLTLPMTWKEKLGDLKNLRSSKCSRAVNFDPAKFAVRFISR
jgi:hypothetical protein